MEQPATNAARPNDAELARVPDPRKVDYFKVVWREARDEIKRRIQQRDKYSIQLLLGIASLLAIAFGVRAYAGILVAAPLVSSYYVTLILYSYEIHGKLNRFLREKIEPRWAEEIQIDPLEFGLENWFSKNSVPGIRKLFFLSIHVALTFLSPYLVLTMMPGLKPVLVVGVAYISFLYVVATWWMIVRFDLWSLIKKAWTESPSSRTTDPDGEPIRARR